MVEPNPKLVQILWRDSSLHIVQEPREKLDVEEIRSVGYIVHEDETSLTLAGDLIGDDMRRSFVIPKENIIGRMDLPEPTDYASLR